MISDINLQAGQWCEVSVQRENFLGKIESKIVRESKFISRRYNVEAHREDITSDIKAWFLQQICDKNSPFADVSCEEAADIFLEKKDYRIREQARSIARKIAGKQSKQAEILADVRQPDLSLDIETQLRAVAASIPRVISEVSNFTPRDSDIYGKEVLRQVGIDDLSGPLFDEVTQIAGVSSSEQRAYNKYHDEHGKNSDSDRKAWTRARAKVVEVFTSAKLTSLLGIAFTLFLALPNYAADQERSKHQKNSVGQNRPVYVIALRKHQ